MDSHTNFARSTVATAPSPATSGTSLTVATGHGARFPATPFNATVKPANTAATPLNAEIVRVTNIASDVLTITRTQESTSARAILVGDEILAGVTVKTITDLEAAIAAGGRLVFGITIDGGGSPITTGVKGFVRIPVACVITKVTLLSIDGAATAGDLVVDIWKDTLANYPPINADSITGGNEPELSGDSAFEDATLTDWDTDLDAGDVVGFNVDSASTVTKVLVLLEATLS